MPPCGRRASSSSASKPASPRPRPRPANTRRTYQAQWARFEAWCRRRAAAALPAAPVLVAAYLTERAETARISTVRVAAARRTARGATDPTGAASVRDGRLGPVEHGGELAEPLAAMLPVLRSDSHGTQGMSAPHLLQHRVLSGAAMSTTIGRVSI